MCHLGQPLAYSATGTNHMRPSEYSRVIVGLLQWHWVVLVIITVDCSSRQRRLPACLPACFYVQASSRGGPALCWQVTCMRPDLKYVTNEGHTSLKSKHNFLNIEVNLLNVLVFHNRCYRSAFSCLPCQIAGSLSRSQLRFTLVFSSFNNAVSTVQSMYRRMRWETMNTRVYPKVSGLFAWS
jgi:hypothetical protein